MWLACCVLRGACCVLHVAYCVILCIVCVLNLYCICIFSGESYSCGYVCHHAVFRTWVVALNMSAYGL